MVQGVSDGCAIVLSKPLKEHLDAWRQVLWPLLLVHVSYCLSSQAFVTEWTMPQLAVINSKSPPPPPPFGLSIALIDDLLYRVSAVLCRAPSSGQ